MESIDIVGEGSPETRGKGWRMNEGTVEVDECVEAWRDLHQDQQMNSVTAHSEKKSNRRRGRAVHYLRHPNGTR